MFKLKINKLNHIWICKIVNVIGIVFLFSTICQAQLVGYRNVIPDAENDIHFTVRINLKFPNNSSTNPLEVADFDSAYYDQVILKLPKNYSDKGDPVKLVYVAHGAGEGVTDSTWLFNKFSIVDSLLENGYAIYDVNGGPEVKNMGGSYVVQSAFKAYEYIRKHYNVDDKIFVFGGSMGGRSSTNFVYRHSNIVLAHGMFVPALALYPYSSTPSISTSAFARATAIAYNFTDKSGKIFESDKELGWNSLYFNTFNNGVDTFKIYPVPVKIWHGINDPIVPIENSRKFQKYIQNAGGYCELRELDTDSHGISCGNAAINRELVLFFKRFDE